MPTAGSYPAPMLNINAICKQPGVPAERSKALWAEALGARSAGQPVIPDPPSPAAPAIAPVMSRRRSILAIRSSPQTDPRSGYLMNDGAAGCAGSTAPTQYAGGTLADSSCDIQQS